MEMDSNAFGYMSDPEQEMFWAIVEQDKSMEVAAMDCTEPVETDADRARKQRDAEIDALYAQYYKLMEETPYAGIKAMYKRFLDDVVAAKKLSATY